MWNAGALAASSWVGVGVGVGVGDDTGETSATFLLLPDCPPCWLGRVQPTRDRKTAARAANHLPLPKSLCTERDAKCISPSAEFQLIKRNRVAQLVEKALRDLLRHAGQPSDLTQQGLLLRRQVLGHDHLHHHVLVSAAPAADVGHPPPRQPERLAVLRPGRDGDLDHALDGRDLDPVAERGLDHVDPQLVDDVLLVPRQLWMRLDAQYDVEVAGRTAAHPRLPLAAEADLRAHVDARRNPDRQAPGPLQAALPAALGTRVLQNPTGAAAGRAGRGRDHLAEERLRRAPDLARAAASRARLGAGARLGAAAGAAVAHGPLRLVDLFLDAGERFLERDRQVVAEVLAAVRRLTPPPRPEAPTEERVEDVRERHVREVDRRTSGADGGVAERVVAAPPVRVGEDRVRLACLLEARGRDRVVGVAVGVRVHGDLAERPLQVLGRGLANDAENLVVVALDRHLSRSSVQDSSFSAGRAGRFETLTSAGLITRSRTR